jgi:TAP-like protein
VAIREPALLGYFGSHFHFMRAVAALPYEMHALAGTDPVQRGAVAADILGYQRGLYQGFALGEWLAVICAEDAPLLRGHRILAASPRLDALVRACGGGRWAPVPAGFRRPLRSDVPALIFTSPMEPAYPAPMGRRLALGFTHAKVIEAANHGHVFDDDWNACLGPQAVRFLDTLDLARVEAGCAGRLKFRPFKLR